MPALLYHRISECQRGVRWDADLVLAFLSEGGMRRIGGLSNSLRSEPCQNHCIVALGREYVAWVG